jgi:copper(I)-binding protein
MYSLLKSALLIAGTTLLTLSAHAQVAVKDAWIRATVPQQKATGAFMQLTASQDTRLVAVTTPLTPVAEVHEMVMQDNIMRMRQVNGIELRAGRAVELKPGGYHVMLMDLPTQVKPGETVPLTLIFEGKAGGRQTLDIQVPVRALNATAAPKDEHADHKH